MSEEEKSNFIRTIIDSDREVNKNEGRVHTRFPPEPNGFLHIGHAKSICLNFSLAESYGGKCNLRFDDSNPVKEEDRYVQAIQEDIKWLGYNWDGEVRFASDYFPEMYELATKLIKAGKAYVCSLSADDVREYRGTLTEPGRNSPYRDRTVEENLELFSKMKAGEFEEGAHILRAKIDMSAPNMNLRDPAIYRILKTPHHRTGTEWCVYPMYDFCHCLSDSFEGITHSVCTLEFEDHRPLYDWILDQLEVHHPQQIEFAKLQLNYIVLSKRNLLKLVELGHVSGWDDPRMPTLAGLRRRGYTPEALKDFCDRIGVAKANSVVDKALLDFCQREHLNEVARRAMVVFNPLKVVITNYPEGKTEELEAANHPKDESQGTRKIPFSGELYVEREDFAEVPPGKWRRLTVGKEVRFQHAYYITCDEVIKDESGEIVELRCSYDESTRGGWSEDGRKVKGTIHWVDAKEHKEITVKDFSELFVTETPGQGDRDFIDDLNPDSLKVVTALAEPGLIEAKAGDRFQFLRTGYFYAEEEAGKIVFNKTLGLRDSFPQK